MKSIQEQMIDLTGPLAKNHYAPTRAAQVKYLHTLAELIDKLDSTQIINAVLVFSTTHGEVVLQPFGCETCPAGLVGLLDFGKRAAQTNNMNIRLPGLPKPIPASTAAKQLAVYNNGS